MSSPTSATMRITELRRTGQGLLEATDNVFEWTSANHASMQDDMVFELAAKVPRKEMPGSEGVVHHGMSATWQPFDFHGDWKDRWLGDSQAWQMFVNFSEMVSRIPLVRFELDALSWVGILTNLKISYRTIDEIGWSCTISPEENESVAHARVEIGAPILQKTIPQWMQDSQDLVDNLHSGSDTAEVIPVSDPSVLDNAAALAEIDDSMTRITAITLGGLEQDPVAQLLTLATTYRRVRNAALTIAKGVSGNRADQAIAFDTFLGAVQYEMWNHGTTADAWRVVGVAREAEIDMRARALSKPKSIYRPKAGESLERISNRFYGTPDNANLIYAANHLTSVIIVGDEELIIPQV